jgi:GTP-binding protein HflX
MANDDKHRVVFISAKKRENIEDLRNVLYQEVRKIHITRYPYNNFLFKDELPG